MKLQNHQIYKENIIIYIIIFSFTVLISCTTTKYQMDNTNNGENSMIGIDTSQLEKDEIFSLLTYAIVYKYWDPIDRGGRGYNVGCILVNDSFQVLDYGLNHVSELDNATQHGEVRLITKYLEKEGIYSLINHTIYSSLEPCAMCGGMMTMVSINRTVNGQPDYFFSKALERLAFNSEPYGGYSPYPRVVKSDNTPSIYGEILDKEYHNYIEQGNKPILTKFLTTSIAKNIFKSASKDFLNFKTKYLENEMILNQAMDFYNDLSATPK